VVEVIEDDEGEEEVYELEEDGKTGGAKRLRCEEKGLLVFEGPVSLFFFF
jgi:hypothetical protein